MFVWLKLGGKLTDDQLLLREYDDQNKETDNMRVLAVLLMTMPLCVAAESVAPMLGMWSWQQKAFDTSEARAEMLEFCKREDIVRVDQHLSISGNLKPKGAMLKNCEALSALLTGASERGIEVNALRGDRDMFFANKHSRTLRELEVIIAFNQSQEKGQKFYGVKYDVEPYLTEQWKSGGEKRQQVMLDYLNYLVKARVKLVENKSTMKLSVDVPFWWDKQEHSLSFSGKKKPFTHHIIDLTDSIGIMSCRRKSDAVLRLAQGELDYAKKIEKNKSISVGLETINLKGEEAFISFWGTPVEEFRATMKQLKRELKNEPSAELIMLHDYRGLKAYLAE